jgi:hypothetical protein
MFSVPAQTKNIEKVVAMIDYFETPDYQYLSEQGIEGYTYNWLPDMTYQRLPVGSNNVGVDQEIYMLGQFGIWGGPQGLFPRVMKPDPARTPSQAAKLEFNRRSMVEAGQALGYPDGFLEKHEENEKFFENPISKFIPTSDASVLVFPTVAETNRINELTPDLDTYTSELITALIMGEKSLDNWDSYIADLKRLGLDEIIAICQARLDRAK